MKLVVLVALLISCASFAADKTKSRMPSSTRAGSYTCVELISPDNTAEGISSFLENNCDKTKPFSESTSPGTNDTSSYDHVCCIHK